MFATDWISSPIFIKNSYELLAYKIRTFRLQLGTA